MFQKTHELVVFDEHVAILTPDIATSDEGIEGIDGGAYPQVSVHTPVHHLQQLHGELDIA